MRCSSSGRLARRRWGREAVKVWTDYTDTFIAGDTIGDLIKVYNEHYGDSAWLINRRNSANWFVHPGDKVIAVNNFTGNEDTVSKTVDEWIVSERPGLLCTTEW